MQWKIYVLVSVYSVLVTGQITITEVMFDPATSEYHDEFIELYNLSYDAYFDVAGLLLSDSSGTDELKTHKGGTKIAPRSFALILDGSYFENSDTYDQVIPDSIVVLRTSDNSLGSGGLSNSKAEKLMIMDSIQTVLSTYRYSIDNEPGHSDEKIILDSSSIHTNWGNSKISGGTPGYRNSISPLATDPGFDQSSLIFPEWIFSGESVHIIIRIYNFGLNSLADSLAVYLFSDDNRDLIHDENENLYLNEDILFHSSSDVFELETWIPGLSAGRYMITVQLLFETDDNPENNSIGREVHVLDRSRSIRINEIKFLTFDNEPEWLELTNIGTETVNLDRWAVCDKKDTVYIDSSLILGPGQFKILLTDSMPDYYDINDSLVIQLPKFPNLNNMEDEIRLLRPDGSWLEYIHYEDSWLEENEQFNPSLERINPELFANNRLNWGPCVHRKRATPGEKNSIFSELITHHQSISAHPDPFSPDNDGIDDVTVISGSLPELRSAIRVRIFDMRGRLTRTLKENQFSGSHFNLVWDGLDDLGRRARIGIYLIFLEEINESQGILRELRCSVVLAQKL